MSLATGPFKVEIRDLAYEELTGAEEVFITGTNKGLVPVIQVDDKIIGDGRPGPNTRHIMAALEKHVEALG